jgi:hypothetical protein
LKKVPFQVEGNMERPLLGDDIDSCTPLWQHDSVFIRLPARYVLQLARLSALIRFFPGWLLGALAYYNPAALVFLVILLMSGIWLLITTR